MIRLLKEIRACFSATITGNRMAVKFEYSKAVFDLVFFYLKHTGESDEEEGTRRSSKGNHLETVIDILDNYGMDPNKFKETLVEMQFNPSKLDLLADIHANVKAGLTKRYNLRHKTSLKAAKKKGNSFLLNEDQALRMINPDKEEELEAERVMDAAEKGGKEAEEETVETENDRSSRSMRTDVTSRAAKKKNRNNNNRRNFNY